MHGRHGPGGKIENLFGLALHHQADATGLVLGQAGQADQVALQFLRRLGQGSADLAFASAESSPATRSSAARIRPSLRRPANGRRGAPGRRFGRSRSRAAFARRPCRPFIRLASKALAVSLASFSLSASRAKLPVSCAARAAALVISISRWRWASPPGDSSRTCRLPCARRATAFSIPACWRASATSSTALSAFNVSSISPIRARCFSCRASTNSALQGGRSETILDALGLGIQLHRRGMGRFRCLGGGRTKSGSLHIQGLRRHLERGFRRLDAGFDLRGPARHRLAGAGGGLGQAAGELLQPLAFGAEPRGDAFAPHFGAGAGFVQGGDLVLQHILQGAQTLESAVQSGVQAVEFAAHGAAQARGAFGSDVIDSQQAVAGGQQMLGGVGKEKACAPSGGQWR